MSLIAWSIYRQSFPRCWPATPRLNFPYDSYVQDQIQTVTRHDIIADSISKLPYAVRYRRGLTPSYRGPALPYEIELLQKQLEVKRSRFVVMRCRSDCMAPHAK